MEDSKVKARAICNPASSGGGYEPEELHRELEGYDLEWITTQSPGDAREAAKEWPDGLLVVVGGDGTISEVVNGLGQAGFPEGITLAILPAGTGNDLAATLAIPEDPAEAVAVLRQNRVRTLDEVRVRSEGTGERFFINVATRGRSHPPGAKHPLAWCPLRKGCEIPPSLASNCSGIGSAGVA